MSAPYFQFASLDRHFDGGLGATGDSFKEAGDKLARRKRKSLIFNPHLPENYLYRHAIELYLKSVIVVLHRVLQLGEPKILVEGKPLPMYRVHQISSLYAHLKAVLAEHGQQVRKMSGFGPKSLTQELDGWVSTISSTDDSSTFFRYPTQDQTKNHEKSSFKSKTPNELVNSMQQGQPKQFSMVFVDDDGRVTEGFQLDREPVAQVGAALKKAASEFSAIHFGVRMELCQGW